MSIFNELSVGLPQLGLFIVVGTIGAFTHYLKKWLRNELSGNLLSYLFRQQPRGTAMMFVSLLGASATLHLGGQLAGLSAQALVMLAFTTGYTLDSAVNRAGDA